MATSEDLVPRRVDEVLFILGMRSPQHEHHSSGFGVDGFDYLFNKKIKFPTVSREVRTNNNSNSFSIGNDIVWLDDTYLISKLFPSFSFVRIWHSGAYF